MPLNDLPPWLSGESDKGFLQGAQLGISAARTGTDIAQTRQQMRESGELQPFRVAAAEIGNRLQRQQVDLGAALFPLKVQQAELQNQMSGLEITSQSYGNRLKGIEVDQVQQDLPKWMDFQADPTAEKATRFTSPVFQRQAGAVLDFKSKTNVEQAAALSRNAFSTSLKELAEMAPDRVPYVTSLLKDGAPTGEAFDQLGTEIAKARLSKQATDEQSKLGLFRGQQDIMEKRQLAIAKENNAAKAANLQSRAGTINQTLGVNQRKAFDAKMKLAISRGDMVEQERIIREFENLTTGGEGGETGPKGRRERLEVDREKLQSDMDAAEREPDPKKREKSVKDAAFALDRVSKQIAIADGAVFNPKGKWKGIFNKGDTVLFPADSTSGEMNTREPHLEPWPGDEEIQKILDGIVTKQKQKDASKASSDSRWLNFRAPGPF